MKSNVATAHLPSKLKAGELLPMHKTSPGARPANGCSNVHTNSGVTQGHPYPAPPGAAHVSAHAPTQAPAPKPWSQQAPGQAPSAKSPAPKTPKPAANIRAEVLEIALWAVLAAAVGVFLLAGARPGFDSAANALVSAGIISGLVATAAMCVLVILSARVPFIDRALGQPRATALHSRFGNWVVIGLLAHTLFLLIGYGLRAGISPWQQLVEWWQGAEGMVLAVISLGSVAVLGLTSVLIVKRRLAYELWHGVHLLSYIVVAASIPHQFALGTLFNRSTVSFIYWVGLLAVTGLVVLVFRVIRPLVNSRRADLRVSRVEQVSPAVVNIYMQGNVHLADGARGGLVVQPGQYFHFRFWQAGLWWHQHPFSVSGGGAGWVRITVRNLGKGSAALFGLRPGTRVGVQGPYGIFTEQARQQDGLVLIGAGVGIAPIRSLVEHARVVPGKAAVICRASSQVDLILQDEIAQICAARGVQLINLVGRRGWDTNGKQLFMPRGYEAWNLNDIVPFVAQSDVYMCGPGGCMDAARQLVVAAGTPREQIHEERFDW